MRAWVATGALVAVFVVVRAVIGLRGYLLGDDFAVRYRAASQPWSFRYAFEPYNDHISPVGFSLQWVLQWILPGSHMALILATAVLLSCALACLAGLMWTLTGRTSGMILAVIICGFGLLTFEITTWWCTTLYSLTFLAFASLGLWGVARMVRDRSGTWMAVIGLVGAVFCDSKGFLVLVLAFGLAAGIGILPGGPLGVRRAWSGLRPVWLAGLVAAAIMVFLVATTTSGAQGDPSVARALRMFWDLWAVNIAPAVLGGPWVWGLIPMQSWAPVRSLPATPMAVGVLSLMLCALGLAFILRARPQVARFVPWAVAYAVAATAIPVLGRSGTNLATPAYRYTYDVVLPVSVLIVLALVPMWWQPRPTSRWLWPVTAGLVVSMAVSTWVPAAAWGHNQAKAYVARAVAGFGAIPEGQAVIPQGVPEDVVPKLLWQYANSQAVFEPQPGAPRFAGSAVGTLFGFAPDGAVVEQEVSGPATPEGKDPDCGYAVTNTPRSIPLPRSLDAWEYMARIAYFSGTDATLNVAIGGQVHSLALPAHGLQAVYFPVNGPAGDIWISVSEPDVTVCVTQVQIGTRVDKATQSPVPLAPRGFAQ